MFINTNISLLFLFVLSLKFADAYYKYANIFKTSTRTIKYYALDNTVESYEKLINAVVTSSQSCNKLSVQSMFEAMVACDEFKTTYWQNKPFVVKSALSNLKDSYQMEDVRIAIENDFFDAGRGSFQDGKSGWNMQKVSEPKGSTFEEAKLHYEDVLIALNEKNGTVVVNSAGGFIPKLAEVCMETVNAIQLPVAINMYLTNPGQKTSAPPHTDKQDVFVLQTSGYKHWRVFAPPPPSAMPRADPFARGKVKDVLALQELTEKEPLIDTTLGPGQFLYVPAGYPHTTDTIKDIPDGSSPSVHLTIGVDTLIWGLTYASLRSIALKKAGIEDKILLTKVPNNLFWKIHGSLPLGFLSNSIIEPYRGMGTAMRNALIKEISTNLLLLMREIEPLKWTQELYSDEEMYKALHLDEVIPRIILHHQDITNIFGTMYQDIAYKITPAKLDLSFFRSQPYYKELEKAMEGLYNWATPVTVTSDISLTNTNRITKNSKITKKSNKGFG